MYKAGVSQVVAMKISGHKTDSVYRRYRIVDEDDIEKALPVTQEFGEASPRDQRRRDQAHPQCPAVNSEPPQVTSICCLAWLPS